MKTTKIISALGLALIFSAVFSVSSVALDNSKKDQISTNSIRYHVNVIVTNDLKIFNVYLVEILDGNGRLVAPARIYKHGVTNYDFYEWGRASGVRVAKLVLAASNTHYAWETELVTTPQVILGPFAPGHTYRFDLFPRAAASRE
jgi:hypothetical protein